MSESPTPSYQPTRRDRGKSSTTLAMIAAVALVASVLIVALALRSNDSTTSAAPPATSSGGNAQAWQAVFLANGEVYFGHLKVGDSSLELRNIYYLNVTQKVQPIDGKDQPQQQPAVERSLIKLGHGELHCPQDQMTINRSQVLYWEDLKAESQVVQAINKYVNTPEAKKKCYDTTGQSGQQSPTASSTTTTQK